MGSGINTVYCNSNYYLNPNLIGKQCSFFKRFKILNNPLLKNQVFLKGQCHEIFYLIFHDSNEVIKSLKLAIQAIGVVVVDINELFVKVLLAVS